MSDVVLSNIVPEKAIKKVQLETLKLISDVVSKTAGPYGAYTMIMNQGALSAYSKDGHKVIKNIKFYKPLEQAISEELLDITEYVVTKVGDGTTSAIQLSYYIYKGLLDMMDTWTSRGVTPYEIIQEFRETTANISIRIRNRAQKFTPEMVEDICLISTNGNVVVSKDIAQIYKDHGNDVQIQVSASNTDNTILKAYDGCILNKGFASPSFVNTDKNTCEIPNPRIYYFADPVDTPDMIQLFVSIFTTNIYDPYVKQDASKYVPTVILAPSVSKDLSSVLQDIDKIFYAFDNNGQTMNKPPLCIITGINDQVDNIDDITTLCGCPLIRRYINPDQRQKDIEAGNAPTDKTITEFYGSADKVIIDIEKMTIVNPKEMFKDVEPDENGARPFSITYNSLVSYLSNQLKIEEEAKVDMNRIAKLRKRLYSLTANFVEYMVGGVAVADRDNVKDLVEDAVLNCRSAAINGVGMAAGVEGFIASDTEARCDNINELYYEICNIIHSAYFHVLHNLYKTAMSNEKARSTVIETLKKRKPYNLRDRSFNGKPVIGSIETDIVILEAISKIITIMFTTNQGLLADPMQNAYLKLNDDDEE